MSIGEEITLPDNQRALCGTRIGGLKMVVEFIEKDHIQLIYPPTRARFVVLTINNN